MQSLESELTLAAEIERQSEWPSGPEPVACTLKSINSDHLLDAMDA